MLGQGGFGVTYLAHDTNLDCPVAIKEYLPTAMAARHADDSVRPLSEGRREDFAWGLDSFLAEARTLARFHHENIVGVRSVFEENGTAYMVMTYERGDSLATLYRQGRLRDQASLERVFFPISDGLAEIHRLGFLHRDIKPANVYIRENGTAVLIDFGSARSMGQQQTGEMTALVSQGYTPLEQYSANYGDQGPWTDVYALAATLHEGITGMKPEEALSRSACVLRRRPDPVAPLDPHAFPAFEPAFLAAVSAGLALQPEDRPTDLDAWRAAFEGRTATAAFDAPDDEATRLRDDEATRLRPPPVEDGRTRLHAAPGSRSAATPPPAPSPARSSARREPLVDESPSGRPAIPDTGRSRARDGAGRAGTHRPAAALETFTEDDLEPPTYRAEPARPRGSAGGRRSGKGGARGRAVALAATVLLGALGGAAWWWSAAGTPSGTARIATLDPTLVDALPMPSRAFAAEARATSVGRRLDELERLAALYRRASDAGASGEAFESGARALRAELGAHARDWHADRHPALVGRIERVAALLPDAVAERAALQATIAAADERSDLAAVRERLARGAIVEPAGDALIDRVGGLGVADYRTLVGSPDWARLIGTLGEGALTRARAADFDGASLLVRAGLTLQPDEPFLRRLGEHLEGGAGS